MRLSLGWVRGCLAAVAVSVAFLTIGAGGASAEGVATCNGGSVNPGTYSSLVIAGACAVDSGPVNVQHNMTVLPGADLYAAFGGSDLTVGGNLAVGKNAVLVLGCEPEAFTCFNDPDQQVGTLSTSDSVGGNLIVNGALAVLSHHNAYAHNVIVQGGGGGVNCDSQDALFGSPAYGTFEDDTIGGNALILGFQSCWLGFFRVTVSHNVQFKNNVTADPDGNEVATNTIGGNLNCSGNDPNPQVGDSGGAPNVVGGLAQGQCSGLVAP